MARDFEDHCWKDIVEQEIIEIYEPYRREVYVGRSPAVLAIDLYNKAYQGGDRPVREVNRRYSGSCGENAWRAIEPTRLLLAAARRPACRSSTPPAMPTPAASHRPTAGWARKPRRSIRSRRRWRRLPAIS
jgi:hypothetical protein